MGEDLFVCVCGKPSSDYRGEQCKGCYTFYCSLECELKCDCGLRCKYCGADGDDSPLCYLCKDCVCDDCKLDEAHLLKDIEALKKENEELRVKLKK